MRITSTPSLRISTSSVADLISALFFGIPSPELPPIGQLQNSVARSLKLRLALSLKMRLGQITYKQTDRAN
ncbi:hypothetical protein E2C01_021881 [Portunus trituberculatus]|uniref:Uncharacterized protein n=1 Tax=Portunus trituberculatus TaxID=210409 RepID=A0A5B7E3S3_PORTR|nr:hypothetical protein [Portunus trituberculatus]